MYLKDLDYFLPQNLIAQKPVRPRDYSRLMILSKKTGKIEHRRFFDLAEFVDDSYVFVFNNSKVLPFRVHGKKETGGRVEVLFLKEADKRLWHVLAKGKLNPQAKVFLGQGIELEFQNFLNKEKVWEVRVNCSDKKLLNFLLEKGRTPLPPYIKTKIPETKAQKWYQSIFAQNPGSVAAPTASFHFTQRLLKKLRQKGVEFVFITLHIGWGTFAPIRTKKIKDHRIHSEWIEISEEAAGFLNQKIKEGKKVLAVGTTAVRALESAATKKGIVQACKKETSLFIYPPFQFKIVKSMITNFHLPKSSLLALVSAFAGSKNILRAYREAVKKKYRFFSFGDAMLIR